MSEPLLQVEELKTYFDTDEGLVRAVDGVSFEVQKGESLGVVGESGSGKSVTQVSVLGLVPSPPGKIVNGRIMFKGQDLRRKSAEQLRNIRGDDISIIWQDPMSSLNPFLKISKQLIEPLLIHRDISKEDARERAIEMLDRVGIPGARERIDQYPHQFSGGMRQRVMIAMALLCEPDLLIADEPTTALDVTIQAQILELLKRLKNELGTSIVTITHDLGVIAGLADRIIVMYAGRIMERAEARKLFERPAHPYTVGLLKSVPRLDVGSKAKLKPIEGNPPDPTEAHTGCPFADRCKWAMDKCERKFPPPIEVDDGHTAHCWRAEEVYDQKLGARASAERVEEVEKQAQYGPIQETTTES